MGFKRQNIDEGYSTTADWLKDFARQLEKKSYNIENLTNIRQMNNGPKKFATIEEKMADIKTRIGFEDIKKMHENGGLDYKTATTDCGCGGSKPDECACDIKTASDNGAEHSESDLKSMSTILRYIQDLCKHEYETLTPIMVISKCREEDGLRFDELPVNLPEIMSFISNILDSYGSSEEETKYSPRDDSQEVDTNPESEFWSHAFPER
jgi:hypothetical protein